MSTSGLPYLAPGEPPPLLPETGTLDVDGCAIRWYAGGTGAPTLVLVHGGGAHSGWWEPVLPGLIERGRVVTMDLSGHGDSGRRADGYPSSAWVGEVAAVISQVAGAPVVLVGHSMGGRLCVSVAAEHPGLVTHLVTLDSVVPAYDGEPVPRVRPVRTYASEEEILAAFKLMPPQPPVEPEVMDRLARRSISQLPDGRYRWKFDMEIFGLMDDRFGTTPEIPSVLCPVTIVLGGLSDVTSPQVAEAFVARLGRPAEVVTFASSMHHTPLDAPGELDQLLARIAGPGPRT